MKGEQEDDFLVCVKGCSWYIKDTPRRSVLHGKESLMMDYYIASSDSTNYYELDSSESKVGNHTPFFARIGEGNVPYIVSNFKILDLWYSLASSCYFANLGNALLIPPLNLPGAAYTNEFRVSAFWQLEEVMPFLPKAIIFDAPRVWNVSNLKLDQQSAGPSNPRVWHYTNCIYSIAERARFKGLLLPKSSLFEFFSENGTNDYWTAAKLSIQVSIVNETSEMSSFVIPLPKTARLTDLRTISSETPFTTPLGIRTNWPDLAKSKAKARAMLPGRLAAMQASSTANYLPVRIVLACAILLPIMLGLPMFKAKWQKQKQLNVQNTPLS
jgi:hypothetical protein